MHTVRAKDIRAGDILLINDQKILITGTDNIDGWIELISNVTPSSVMPGLTWTRIFKWNTEIEVVKNDESQTP